MATTQYIGARYVPLLADPTEWNSSNDYEPLTIVLHQGNSYTSRQFVPAGIDILNGNYWALTGNYNGQVEQYRQEVRTFDNRITQAQTDASNALTQVGTVAGDVADLAGILTGYGEGDTVKADVSTLQGNINALDTKVGTLPEGESSVVDYIGNEVQTINVDLTDIDTRIDGIDESITEINASLTELSNIHAVFIGDSFSTTTFVADSDRWCYKVARSLKATPHIFAANGAGFVRQGGTHKNFQDLLDDAADNSSAYAEKVKYVFILGGLNDLQDTYYTTAFGTGVRNCIDKAQAAFPNALVYICGVNSWSTGFSWVGSANTGNLWAERQIKGTVKSYGEGVVFIPMAWALAFDASLYTGTPPHPNASGQHVMAAWILNAMNGLGLSSNIAGLKLYDANDTEIGTMTIHATPSAQEIVFNLTATAEPSGIVHDDYHILGENTMSVQGCPLCLWDGGVGGFMWTRVSTGANYKGHGFGRMVHIVD